MRLAHFYERYSSEDAPFVFFKVGMQEERRGRVDCPQFGTSQCTSVNCFCGREPPAYKVLVKRLYLADQMVQFVWH